eukprot:288165-Prymnesium_polylepis.1
MTCCAAARAHAEWPIVMGAPSARKKHAVPCGVVVMLMDSRYSSTQNLVACAGVDDFRKRSYFKSAFYRPAR